MHTETIEYAADGVRYVGSLAVDRARGGTRPGVLVCPEGGGLGDPNRKRARLLAGKIYDAMPEMLARLGVLRTHERSWRAMRDLFDETF